MFCEDAHTINHLLQRGLKLVCVPEATVVNQESTTVSGCLRFVNRQMFIFRLYHRHWLQLVGIVLLGAFIRIGNIHLIIDSLIAGEWSLAGKYFAAYMLVPLAMWIESWRLDSVVRRLVRRNGQEVTQQPIPIGFVFFCAETMFLTSMLTACLMRRVQWRGVSYEVDGPVAVRLLEYRPFVQTAAAVAAPGSSVV